MTVLLASAIDPAAVASLQRSYDVRHLALPADVSLARRINGCEVMVLRSGVLLDEEALRMAPQLRLIVRAGSGLDNIDLDAAARLGIRVVRIAGMSAPPVAEFTFALLLALARKVTIADRAVRAGHWPKAELGGRLLRGKTLGVVGAGNIGGLVGQMGAAWGMRVLGCVAHPSGPQSDALRARHIEPTAFDDVVERSDFVTLHVPLDDSTRRMVDGSVLQRMRPGSLLVNVARGGVVDEKALYEALTVGDTLTGAALDVHENEGEGVVSPLADLPNVILTPHIGAMALDSQRLIGERVVDVVDAFYNGRLDEEVRDGECVV